MVSASFFAVALFASIAFVSALPAPSLARIDSGHHLGTGDITVTDTATDAVQVNGLIVTNNLNGGHAGR